MDDTLPSVRYCVRMINSQLGALMRFTQFNFHPNILSDISVAGHTNPTPIQQQTIPPILQGKDVLGLAQTVPEINAIILPERF